jgi:hypothetical protein
MEPWLEELIARARQTGYLTYGELNADMLPPLEPEQVNELLERLEANGITLIDDLEDETPEPPQPEPDPEYEQLAAELEAADVLGGHYHRNAEFDKLLRANGVPFSDAACSFQSNGLVFDAELIVPGGQALAAWLALRNLVPVTQLWPVIKENVGGPSFTISPVHLDPGRRWEAWRDAWRKDRTIAFPEPSPEVIRADAAANIAEAEKVPPTPWTFRRFHGQGREPQPPTDLDDTREPPEPDLAHLFSDAGPFRAHRQGYGGSDWPAHPFVRVRLYPTAVPWEVFAYTWDGGWNDCPHPDEQLAMLRHWHACCGVEVVSHLGDWYELFVPRPPRSRHQAERLIHEMGYFGEETFFSHGRWSHPDPIEAVRTSHYWHFWWD